MLNAELVTQKFNCTDLKKKKITIYRFYNNIQRPIKREREKEAKEVKGDYKDSRGEREEE